MEFFLIRDGFLPAPKDLRIYKTELRQQIKQTRRDMPDEERCALDAAVLKNLLHLREYKLCDKVLCYVSTDIEVDTRAFIDRALADGKQVAVPRCLPDAQMEFHYIGSLSELSPGAFSVLEPSPDAPVARSDERTLLIVPALAIDRRGYRLGYGKGYYDRYISDFAGITVGVCYSRNKLENIYHGRYDRPVSIVVTERFITTLKYRAK